MRTNIFLFNMRHIWFLILLLSPVLFSAQVSQSLHQSFSSSGAESILIQVNSPNLTTKYIQGTRILVETKVNVSMDNATLLSFLVQKGRYDLTTELDTQSKCLKISPRNKENLILIKGKQIQENISYVIYIPETMKSVDLAQQK